MNRRNPEIVDDLNAGGIVRLRRNDLATGSKEQFTELGERALLTCLMRLAALPQVEGVAFSRIRASGSLYYTVIERNAFLRDEATGQAFVEITDAIHDFGDTLGEIMPGSFMNLSERGKFASAVRHLRGKRLASELNLLGIVHFVK